MLGTREAERQMERSALRPLEKHVSRELAHCGRVLGGHVGIEPLADDLDGLTRAEPLDKLAGNHVLTNSRRRAGVAEPAFTLQVSAFSSHGLSFAPSCRSRVATASHGRQGANRHRLAHQTEME